MKIETEPVLKPRRRNNRTSSNGVGVRSSHTANPTRPASRRHPFGSAAQRLEPEGFGGKGMDQVAGQGLGRAACRRALCR